MNQDNPFFHLGAAAVAIAACMGLGLIFSFSLLKANEARRNSITAIIGAEITLGKQTATVVGPYKGYLQVSLKNANGSSSTALLDYEIIEKINGGLKVEAR